MTGSSKGNENPEFIILLYNEYPRIIILLYNRDAALLYRIKTYQTLLARQKRVTRGLELFSNHQDN